MKKIFGIICTLSLLILCLGCSTQPFVDPTNPVDVPQETIDSEFPNTDALMIEYVIDWSKPMEGLENVLIKSVYTVKYDGTISSYSEYAGGTRMNIGDRKMSIKQLKAFYELLTSNPIGEEKVDIENKPLYTIRLFNPDGVEELTFNGVLTPYYRDEFERYLHDIIIGEEGVLLEVSYCEVAPTPDRDDVWDSSNWKVYRNGTVEYHDSYKGGPGETNTWNLTSEQIEKLEKLLEKGIPVEDMIPCDIPLYDIKYYEPDGTVKTDFWGMPTGDFLDKLMSQIDKEPPEQAIEETAQVMAIVKAENWGLLSMDEDSWLSTIWTVYYNRRVERTTEYRFSGTKTESWELTRTQWSAAYDFFQENKNVKPTNACDGTGYAISFFESDGTSIFNFNGYVYGTPFEGVEDYLTP